MVVLLTNVSMLVTYQVHESFVVALTAYTVTPSATGSAHDSALLSGHAWLIMHSAPLAGPLPALLKAGPVYKNIQNNPRILQFNFFL